MKKSNLSQEQSQVVLASLRQKIMQKFVSKQVDIVISILQTVYIPI